MLAPPLKMQQGYIRAKAVTDGRQKDEAKGERLLGGILGVVGGWKDEVKSEEAEVKSTTITTRVRKNTNSKTQAGISSRNPEFQDG